jgi:hypothetical protein
MQTLQNVALVVGLVVVLIGAAAVTVWIVLNSPTVLP